MIFQLGPELVFPHPDWADDDGLLAIGGDLSPQRLLLAYENGIFPWYGDDMPLLWHSPDPRFVVMLNEVRYNRMSIRATDKSNFTYTFDTAFERVIDGCAAPRRDGPGTWITPEMRAAYIKLHQAGFCHSIEVWKNGELAGGLYGLSLGSAFFAESMFHVVSNASRAAFFKLCRILTAKGFLFLDSQVKTPHVEQWGGRDIPRCQYLELLAQAMETPTIQKSWADWLEH